MHFKSLEFLFLFNFTTYTCFRVKEMLEYLISRVVFGTKLNVNCTFKMSFLNRFLHLIDIWKKINKTAKKTVIFYGNDFYKRIS